MWSTNSLAPAVSWAPDALRQSLAQSHSPRCARRVNDCGWEASLEEEVACRLERELIEGERAAIAPQVRQVPTDAPGSLLGSKSSGRPGPAKSTPSFRGSPSKLHWTKFAGFCV